MHEELASSSSPTQNIYQWRDILAKFVLFFFGVALWHKGLSLFGGILLALAWVLDGSLHRLKQAIRREPLVLAILLFCTVLALGIFWSDDLRSGYNVWKKYAILLVFIPFLYLLNKERLPWAISGLLAGYSGVLFMGVYQWIIVGDTSLSFPLLKMSRTGFSGMLGIGVILAIYLAGANSSKKVKPLLWIFASLLLFIQFNQGARGVLLATLFSLLLLIFMRYRTRIKALLGVTVATLIVVGIFAYSSTSLENRLIEAQSDIELSQQGKYTSSSGYRLAMWDVGLHGIAQHPWFGHGTGMPSRYFDETVVTYKDGLYKDLPGWLKTYHYHNDWIEIGMQIGALGLLTYAFFLWSWFQTLRARQLTTLGAVLVCFVFVAGLVETLVFFRVILYLLLVITAIAIVWQKEYGSGIKEGG
ncbi:MAG: O-antigen ligase family protein [Nitrosospira sp.]|nr:O-antigen ligase family protein [Nitrosospira sp.]